jgi:hypothetical protein
MGKGGNEKAPITSRNQGFPTLGERRDYVPVGHELTASGGFGSNPRPLDKWKKGK